MKSKRGIHKPKPCKTIRIGGKLYLFRGWGKTTKGKQQAIIQHILTCTNNPWYNIRYNSKPQDPFIINWPINDKFLKVELIH